MNTTLSEATTESQHDSNDWRHPHEQLIKHEYQTYVHANVRSAGGGISVESIAVAREEIAEDRQMGHSAWLSIIQRVGKAHTDRRVSHTIP